MPHNDHTATSLFDHLFSQQLAFNDDPVLAAKLGMSIGDVKKFEVFVTKKCAGNLRHLKKESLTQENYRSIIQQMLEMLKHLKTMGRCHNDIKPANLLNNRVQTASGFNVDLRLGDFGLCDKLGGTPGWSPADFTNKREPGVSFSMNGTATKMK